MAKKQHAVSLICGDLNNLEGDIRTYNRSGIDLIHFDVMDGIFVPGFGLSEKHLNLVRPTTSLPIEVHLMTVEPERHIDVFAREGADIVSVHVETCPHLHRTIEKIRNKGIGAGVIVNPATTVDSIRHVLPNIEIVTLMSIDPGLIGADFLPLVIPKIAELRQLIDGTCSQESRPKIQIDGSLDRKRAEEVFTAGADIAVHGAKSFFSSEKPLEEAISQTIG